MIKTYVYIATLVFSCSAFAQRSGPSSETNPRLASALAAKPELDTNKDGILTLKEALAGRPERKVRMPKEYKVQPTHAEVAYGQHDSMKLDFWGVESEDKVPLFVWIHGGGFRSGDKKPGNPFLLEKFLDAGVAVASINYRLTEFGPFPMQMHDSARALQFIRSKATLWGLDPDRVVLAGGSAGSCIAQWLAFHEDLANPESDDPVERESTRVSCVLALNMQSTLDPRVIKDLIPGKAHNEGGIKLLYGVPDDWNWDVDPISPELDALIVEASMINHLSPDDPPVYIYHHERSRNDGNIHHPNFGNYLEEAMNRLEVECIRRTSSDYETPHGHYDEMLAFALGHLDEK